MIAIYLFSIYTQNAFFSFPFPTGFVAEERAKALETLQCFITGTTDCKDIAGKMQSFKQ